MISLYCSGRQRIVCVIHSVEEMYKQLRGSISQMRHLQGLIHCFISVLPEIALVTLPEWGTEGSGGRIGKADLDWQTLKKNFFNCLYSRFL